MITLAAAAIGDTLVQRCRLCVSIASTLISITKKISWNKKVCVSGKRVSVPAIILTLVSTQSIHSLTFFDSTIYLYRVAKCTKHQYEGLVRNIVVLAAIAVVVVGTGRRSARPLIVVTAGSGSSADIREIVLLSAYHHRGLLLLSTRLHPSLIHPHHYEPTQTKTCLALERYSLASLSQL